MSVATVHDLSRLPGVRTATELFSGGEPHPVDDAVRPLFAAGGLARGAITQITGDHALSLSLASAAALTREGKWCALLAAEDLAVSALLDLGVDPDRFVHVRTPAVEQLRVMSILLESFDCVLVAPPAGLAREVSGNPGPASAARSGHPRWAGHGRRMSAGAAARLAAKVRERRMSLVMLEPNSSSTERLHTGEVEWSGLGAGTGRLEGCLVDVESSATGTHRLWLPGPAGRAETAGPRLVPDVAPAEVRSHVRVV